MFDLAWLGSNVEREIQKLWQALWFDDGDVKRSVGVEDEEEMGLELQNADRNLKQIEIT